MPPKLYYLASKLFYSDCQTKIIASLIFLIAEVWFWWGFGYKYFSKY